VDKIWLKSYPARVPPEIDAGEFSSINQMLGSTFRRFPQHPAYRNLGKTLTYAQIERLSRDFAAWLQGLPGLGKGSRIALMMPNILQYPIALFGALRAGLIVVNVNPQYTARELEHQLRDSGAEAIVVVENFAHVLQKVLPNTQVKFVVTTQIGDILAAPRRWLVNVAVKRVERMVPAWHIEGAIGFRTALRRGAGAKLDEPPLERRDIAFLQYTGGTTGLPKGAILTHGNVIANVLQMSAWCRGILEEGQDILVTALPLYHVFSLVVNCLLGAKFGGLILLITNPRDMLGFVRELKNSHFTVITGVNALYNRLLDTPGFAAVDFGRMKFGAAGGGPVQSAVAQRWQAITGKPMVEGYGLTEATIAVALNPLDSQYSGTAGLPVPSTEVGIFGEDDRELPPGADGEICVRGPQLMQGYWRQPEETAKAFMAGGWLRTGDIGVMDERGYLRITDRKKDMIVVSGFKVYPTEVEGVVASLPGVMECAVVGVPDAATGEAVKVFIVKRDAADLFAEDIIAHCRRELTNYKVPKFIEFRGDLPKNPIGKVLRRDLRPSMPQTGGMTVPTSPGSIRELTP
jgi:long-chain acyl-CoA synthetase